VERRLLGVTETPTRSARVRRRPLGLPHFFYLAGPRATTFFEQPVCREHQDKYEHGFDHSNPRGNVKEIFHEADAIPHPRVARLPTPWCPTSRQRTLVRIASWRVPDLPIPELVENRRRSVAMLPPGAPALNRDEALELLDQLEAALVELRKLRAQREVR
jgi:hypothetical protein